MMKPLNQILIVRSLFLMGHKLQIRSPVWRSGLTNLLGMDLVGVSIWLAPA